MRGKKLLLCIFMGIAAISYSQTEKINSDLQRAEARFNELVEREAQKKAEFTQEKATLEQEVAQLKEKVTNKDTKLEKLKVDTEVRWHRDEYRKILKEYKGYYETLEQTIAEKEKRIAELTEILTIMSY